MGNPFRPATSVRDMITFPGSGKGVFECYVKVRNISRDEIESALNASGDHDQAVEISGKFPLTSRELIEDYLIANPKDSDR